MSTYKVIQDIEAEDKLLGPLTLRQCIYAAIAALCGWLGFIAISKHAAFMLVILVPIMATCAFFAFPWGQDQPTEVWALAKIRFFLKPRKRVWDQGGIKQLVTVTAPKAVERILTNGLNQDEVRSRLSALANTIDSRGWAIKNVNVNLANATTTQVIAPSDRLVTPSSLPQQVSSIDVRASDDMLDELASPIAQQFDRMITASTAAHHQQILAQMQQPAMPPARPMRAATPPAATQPPANYWFMQPQPPTTVPAQATFVDTPVVMPATQTQLPAVVPQAATPTAEEEALVQRFKQENSSQTVAYGHMKTLKTPQQLMADAAAQQQATTVVAPPAKPTVTPDEQAVIMNLATNDDLSVAAIARQAHKEVEQGDDGEVVISLR